MLSIRPSRQDVCPYLISFFRMKKNVYSLLVLFTQDLETFYRIYFYHEFQIVDELICDSTSTCLLFDIVGVQFPDVL